MTRLPCTESYINLTVPALFRPCMVVQFRVQELFGSTESNYSLKYITNMIQTRLKNIFVTLSFKVEMLFCGPNVSGLTD